MIYQTTPGGILDQDYLIHHGIKGQKWGERRFQNPDGSLTPEGQARYREYVKDFGSSTANRLVKSLQSGKSEHQALLKEYHRRFGAGFVPVATGVAGGVAGMLAENAITNGLTNRRSNLYVSGKDKFTGLNVLSEKKNFNLFDPMQDIGTYVGGALGAAGGMAINKISSDYSPKDLSIDGLRKFARKMAKYDKSLKEMNKNDEVATKAK